MLSARAQRHNNMGSLAMDFPQQILLAVEKNGSVISYEFAKALNEPHQKIVGAIKSLESLGEVVSVKQTTQKTWECTEEGASLVANGSHEARLFNSLTSEGCPIADIKANFPNANIALGAAMKNKWVKKEGEKIVPVVTSINDEVQIHLQAIMSGSADNVPDKVKVDYKKRKLIKEVELTVFEVTKGSEFTTSISKQEAELTKDMIESGQWKSKSFKPFNFKAKGRLDQRSGHLHPLMQLRSEFRQIFLEMGFTEMPTNNFVESAFWNFDALFQPQQHPARDAHDTFYVAEPEKTLGVPEDYLQRVKKTHSTGGYGSLGYQYDWSRDEAHKNLLRTHTTAVSARMLYKLAQEGFRPVKFFSIDRVFRNETLDATHLAEFHQIEGVVADYNLSVKHLMGVIKGFFEKIGITKLRFKPAYNPYTEPSMEIFSYHEGLKKWVEVGNSGMFRPEMLRPMGVPENVTVAAWGLSLERPAMIMYGINNIRELVGSRVKMELILDNPVCTIDKFKGQSQKATDGAPTVESLTKRQELILDRLSALQSKVASIAAKMGVTLVESAASITTQLTGGVKAGVVHDVVIYADPRRPPYSLRILANALSSNFSVCLRVHCHSSVKEVSEKLQQFWGVSGATERSQSQICLTLVWRQDGDTPTALMPSLSVSPLAPNQIRGEHNVGRYLARLAEVGAPTCRLYECLSNPIFTVQVDELLDQCHGKLTLGNNKEKAAFIRELNVRLGDREFLVSSDLTLADAVILSTLLQLRMLESAPSNVQKWSKSCLILPYCKNLI
ncbi:phenylalanine--tRNA ligase alpha subunit-like [Penaeus japonicus]|uniref:phenylalanine--tRNA ligase alpha subunit-like n=1 Tax=Penaeus japonicus TaxID=27405 RepID=UPI001C71237A|nr:phenylalanine--tRNA ligase alpha subunit-like [Penaeus japonicus]